jgi:hypothetical protein
MMRLRSILPFLLCTACLAARPSNPPSPAMKRILRDRLVGRHDLRLDGLTKMEWTRERFERFTQKTPLEIYHVPYPRGAADYFSYTIYRLKLKPKYAILVTGGFAGVFEVYTSQPED